MIDVLARLLADLPLWQATLLILGLSIAAAVVIEAVLLRAIRRLVSRTESRLDDIIFQELRLPLVVTAALAGVWFLSQTPAAGATLLGAEGVDRFFGRPSLSVIVLVWAWALNQTVNRFVEEMAESGTQYEFAPVFSNVWTLFVVSGAAALLLTIWRIEITPLLGAAGIAGIAIGFAAKDTVANFFGGLALYFDDTYKLGDFVVLDSGESGTVVKIGIRSTTLLTRSDVLVTVPNSVLNAAKIRNESSPQRRKRIKVPIGVAYGTDIDAFESLVRGVAEEESLVLDSPEPRMRFRRFGDSALEYELLCWIRSPTREGKARHELNRAIYATLTEAGIEIPYPKRDVTFSPNEVAGDRAVHAERERDPPA